jgi:hypothetical protein
MGLSEIILVTRMSTEVTVEYVHVAIWAIFKNSLTSSQESYPASNTSNNRLILVIYTYMGAWGSVVVKALRY